MSVQVLEKIVLEAENDGALENMVVTGELVVTVFDSQYSKIKVKVRPSDAKEFQYKVRTRKMCRVTRGRVIQIWTRHCSPTRTCWH